MIEFIRTNIIFIVIGVFLTKYTIQFYYKITNRKQKIALKEKPFVSSALIWLIALIIFGIFVFQRNAIHNYFIGLSILLTGVVIGVLGLLYLNINFHDNLVIYDHSFLVKTGIYSIIRHPIRLGICLETLALVFFINSFYIIPIYLIYLFLNYKRTTKEEKFLIEAFETEAEKYFIDVPKFNIFYGLILKFIIHKKFSKSIRNQK